MPWFLWSLLSVAAELPVEPDGPVPTLPLQTAEHEARWEAADAKCRRVSRTSLVIGAASLGAGAVGAGLYGLGLVVGDEIFTSFAGVAFTGAVVGGAVAPPLLLASGLRANRTLRRRGVYSTRAPGMVGWGIVALGVPLIPVFVVAPYTIPVWYAGVTVAGLTQIEANGRARRESGLPPVGPLVPWVAVVPDLRGVRIVGVF